MFEFVENFLQWISRNKAQVKWKARYSFFNFNRIAFLELVYTYTCIHTYMYAQHKQDFVNCVKSFGDSQRLRSLIAFALVTCNQVHLPSDNQRDSLPSSQLVLDPWSAIEDVRIYHVGYNARYWTWVVSVDFDELAVGYDANALPLYNVHLRISVYRLYDPLQSSIQNVCDTLVASTSVHVQYPIPCI